MAEINVKPYIYVHRKIQENDTIAVDLDCVFVHLVIIELKDYFRLVYYKYNCIVLIIDNMIVL